MNQNRHSHRNRNRNRYRNGDGAGRWRGSGRNPSPTRLRTSPAPSWPVLPRTKKIGSTSRSTGTGTKNRKQAKKSYHLLRNRFHLAQDPITVNIRGRRVTRNTDGEFVQTAHYHILIIERLLRERSSTSTKYAGPSQSASHSPAHCVVTYIIPSVDAKKRDSLSAISTETRRRPWIKSSTELVDTRSSLARR